MRRLLGVALLGALPLGCKGPIAKIERLRDALADDSDATSVKSATAGLPACGDLPPLVIAPGQPSPRDKGCLSEIANALGSKKGFNPSPPDQAADATVAVILARDRRGDWIAHSDVWLSSIKNGIGPGADTLRLAVARGMADAAPLVGRRIESDADANATMKAIAESIPGACPTYFLIGSGTDPRSLAAELSSEHAACVHKDLSRREGAGPSYGDGTFRALEGALSLWREAERSLRLGQKSAAESVKPVLEKRLAVIQDGTKKSDPKKLADTVPKQTTDFIGQVHADAGVVLWKDAGAADAATAQPVPLRKPLP